MIQTNYTQARANLAQLFDEVTDSQQVAIVNRRGKDDVAIIAASELSSLVETAHLLRSPKNAERLMSAMSKATAGEEQPQALGDLRRELGFEE
jgi:antitoxin YefM